MSHVFGRSLLGVSAAGLLLAFGSARAATSCFFINQWQAWKAPDDHTIYLGVNAHDVYELDLAGGSDLLRDPDARLVDRSQGPDTVCEPLDLQLSVATFGGVREPLILKRIRRLSPEEIAAIPKRYRPF